MYRHSQDPFVRWQRIGLILGFVCLATFANVPPLINFQGRVSVNGKPFNGVGQFAFALINTNGSTTYWSNDGSSISGSQPSNSIALNVAQGLYSVVLGDSSVSNMTQVVPPTVFTNSDIALRIWFDDGANGFQALSPDQRLVSVGYAMNAHEAATVVDGGITSSKIANGQVVRTLNQLQDDVTLAPGKNISISTVGSVITVSAVGAGSGNGWALGGNGGFTPGLEFLGTTDTSPVEFRVNNDRVFRLENNLGLANVIGGSRANSVESPYGSATIAGGGTLAASNHIHAYSGAIGGGLGNGILSGAADGVIAGGYQNLIDVGGNDSAIGGGHGNQIQPYGNNSFIGGGYYNVLLTNTAYAVLGGGIQNTNGASQGFLGGGYQNVIRSSPVRPSSYSAVVGGANNTILEGSIYSTVGGGYLNVAAGYGNTLAGGRENFTTNQSSTVSGGFQNQAAGDFATVSGGNNNIIRSDHSSIGGGDGNFTDHKESVISGGNNNFIGGLAASGTPGPVGGDWGTIAGGYNNLLQGDYGYIGGGSRNAVGTQGLYGGIGGGSGNSELSYFGFIGGGELNSIARDSDHSVISGGWENTISFNSIAGAIGGGRKNSAATFATVSGGGGEHGQRDGCSCRRWDSEHRRRARSVGSRRNRQYGQWVLLLRRGILCRRES
jgi:hypothetical protein